MEDDLEADSLDELFESLVPLDDLLHEIRRCIISEEEISDDASSTLKHIRRAMKQTNQKIHTQLTTLVSSASNQDKLQDAIVTMRNGRYCIPVKQEYRSSFQGMIHDQSASGNTLFIEPMSVVTLNNELKELEGKEQSEIEHILSILSEQASYGVDDLAHNQKTLVLLDFIFAKVICRANKDYYTVSIGLWNMLEKEYVYPWFNSFAAGAVLISIPIIILFMFMQKCYRESFSGGVKG